MDESGTYPTRRRQIVDPNVPPAMGTPHTHAGGCTTPDLAVVSTACSNSPDGCDTANKRAVEPEQGGSSTTCNVHLGPLSSHP